jgi:hypothetical protein
MKEIRYIKNQLIKRLQNIRYEEGDLSDIGNEIGIILGDYMDESDGFKFDDFISGLKHGISLTQGTH